jgi:ferredoxin
MMLRECETQSSSLTTFPSDKTPDLCAAGAMSVRLEIGVPSIDTERCIACGVCAARCPVGAIYLDPAAGAQVSIDQSPAFIEAPDEHQPTFKATFDKFSTIEHAGVLAMESDTLIRRTLDKMKLARINTGDRFPVLHARNLLIVLGQGAAMRRKGNNHMRMDLLLGPPGVVKGVVEVEFGQSAVLDAPRDLLDALAVLTSRYQWQMKELASIIITDELPNKRSEYWEIVKDIRDVTGIRISTITVFALHLLTWSRTSIPCLELFHVDKDSGSYRSAVLEKCVGRPLTLGGEPRSWIEIAK